MKFEGLIFSLFSVLLLIGIANAQVPTNVFFLLNQSSCFFNYITISTNANVMTCHTYSNSTIFRFLQYPYFAIVNSSFGRPLFFTYNSSKNTIPNGISLNFMLPNGTTMLLSANKNFLIAIYPNGSIYENNNLLYKFSKPQDEIGIYQISISSNSSFPYKIDAVIKTPKSNIVMNTPLKANFSNQNIVIGYEKGFDNLTITTNSNDVIELSYENLHMKSTSPLIYNLYNLATIPPHYLPPPVISNTSLYFYKVWLFVNDADVIDRADYTALLIPIGLFEPYFWVNNQSEPIIHNFPVENQSKLTFVSNVVGSKVLEINFTNVSSSLVYSTANFYWMPPFNKSLLVPSGHYQGTGNISLSMATNPNETEIISGNLIYKYDNETYYYNFTNLSLMQGQLKRIVIPVIPKNITKTTTAKCNIELCILLILIIIILLIIITWRIKKHFEKKKRKI